MKTVTALAVVSLAIYCASTAYADTFGSGANTFDIDFVTIGNTCGDFDGLEAMWQFFETHGRNNAH